ncbi:hypothetical protein MNBD_ACTINO02-2632 [hydrothermal vent metagenome]|uniref:Uncharacterized protein n=1 Tax=hydrothermal vent metagenome TaxID=652676 RepID=A0A3B0TCF4_9ZZZZ
MTRRPLLLFVLIALLASSCAGNETAPEQVTAIESELQSFEQQLLVHEEAIADCMRRQGFPYVVGLPSDWILEKAAQLDVARGGDGLVDIEVPQDPNEEAMAQASPEERDAFKFAYWGDIGVGGQTEGCYNSTYKEVWGTDLFEDDTAAINDVLQRIETDERVVAALDQFTTCMNARGFDVATIDDISRLIDIERESLRQRASEEGKSPEDVEGYESLLSFELAANMAYDECIAAYNTTYDEVHVEYLQNYYADQ